MLCLTCTQHNIVKYMLSARLNTIHQRQKKINNYNIIKRDIPSTGKKLVHVVPRKNYGFINKSRLLTPIIKLKLNNKRSNFNYSNKTPELKLNQIYSSCLFILPLSEETGKKKKKSSYTPSSINNNNFLPKMSHNICQPKPNDSYITEKKSEKSQDEGMIEASFMNNGEDNIIKSISNNLKEVHDNYNTNSSVVIEGNYENFGGEFIKKKVGTHLIDALNRCKDYYVQMNSTTSKQFFTSDDIEYCKEETSTNRKKRMYSHNESNNNNNNNSNSNSNNNNNVSGSASGCGDENVSYSDNGKGCKIFSIEELENMRRNSNYLKINETENEDYSIELYFDFKELKLLRKKSETLKSLINRLILNLRKLEKNDKRKKKKKKMNEEKNEHEVPSKEEVKNENVINCIQFFDNENNLIDENTILKDIIDKLKYVCINDLKISIFKGLYDLKQIYISMDVFNGHPIIPANVPVNDIDNYVYYWVCSSDKNIIKSCELFYKASKEDISKKIQLVIYNKENPFFFYITEEIEVNPNAFEEELKLKEKRYMDFKKLNMDNDNDNVIRILSYNILAPIYTNTKYALEYMFKNVEECYLKTNYRSHLLIHDINYDYDIISLQEVSEHLHSNLFSIYLHEKFYSSYKGKNNYGNDGCSLFVNKKKFSLIEYKNYEFKEVIKIPDLKDVYDRFISLSQDLVEIIREIKTIFQVGIYVHNNTGSIFLIANTHLYFHSLAQHIRAIQSYCILYILEVLKNKYKQEYSKNVYVVLNGDFNTNFESEVFSFLEGKDISSNSDVWMNSKLFKKEYDDLNTYPTLFELKKDEENSTEQVIGPSLNRQKFLPLYSAYKKGDISYTNWNNNFIDVLDYIFLSPGIKVRRILKGLDQKYFDKYKGLLSPINPSDHLSIAAEVEI
ncbi:endonuclease/exonuclease/phosphatase family protein, putative [Plasmodium malariae]|uniref:Endonuclease/exonuclease/phosphatase family protein, putative n=1 Tax=Plasmodium malariae TaxID=5858 RepID=A0A1D3PB04_PLAMA|nr:endonuclease/exonuclease/phosphatase family protein, putative [Plasmodium malariae]SCN12244.1 endonuclease/exonuclease/phosphatase family protein, putative [Plasmodium malariae]